MPQTATDMSVHIIVSPVCGAAAFAMATWPRDVITSLSAFGQEGIL